ncbi:sugar-transfer associated ATP-grasp domain-containing protein [Kaistella palustris]|uniref:sugar-transfer associated ATP-grasp domain-containing protein n=1 Tax=Kaistella palustris TaxID=493376 RepID=UPI00146B569F|nr:sugar-transfer associated ATP-grasp domain-containing protein [Kaistella palustris]
MKENGLNIIALERNDTEIYKKYWKPFHWNIETDTIHIVHTLSGKFDRRIIPENIFFSDIELTLNYSKSKYFLTNKSMYNRWYKSDLFPKDYLHKMNEIIYDSNLVELSNTGVLNETLQLVKFPVVIKPNIDTSGGSNIFFINDLVELKEKMRTLKNYVVQERLVQNTFFSNITNAHTIRVCLYKSVKDNQVHILNMALRMGKDGSLDNDGAGGIALSINEKTGKAGGVAYNKYGTKYHKHPNSNVALDFTIPYFDKLCANSVDICENIIDLRIISLDMFLDSNNEWRVIEVNLYGHSIRFAQYFGKPFFGEFTDEVKEYCLVNHWAFQDQKLL